MKRVMSTAVSRAWLAVALVGMLVVIVVIALQLIARLSAGQQVIDAAGPAFAEERVAGTRAGVDFFSSYVDLADPLVTRRGGASRQVPKLVALIRRRTGLSTARVRRILRREAPHVEALTRALPLSGLAAEVPRLTSYLATTLTMSEDELALALAQSFPRIAQTLTALPIVTSGWYDVPGTEELTRLDGSTPVTTVPGLRDYYRADLVPLVERHDERFRHLAGWGGVGYIPYLLLVVGLGLLAFGVVQARRSLKTPVVKVAWRVVVGAGVVILLLVAVLQYFPRLGGAEELTRDFEPAFEMQRVDGARNGIDLVHEAVRFGAPIMTARGGAAGEVDRLYAFVGSRTGLSRRQVRRALRRQVPRTAAILEAIPLSRVAAEVPDLLALLATRMKMSRARLTRVLRPRTPALAQSLLSVSNVTSGWNSIPGTERLTRFDGVTAARTMPELDNYLRQDLIPILPSQREHFDKLASTWPPLTYFPPLLVVVGALLALYGGLMMRRAARA